MTGVTVTAQGFEVDAVTIANAFGLDPAQLQEILRRIESSDRLTVVDSMTVATVRGMPNASLTAVAYYRVGASQEKANGKR